MLDLTQGRRLLQFLPGSPGSHRRYRMDPAARFPPQTSNFLTTAALSSSPVPSPSQQHQVINHHLPPPRSRSRSRERCLSSHLEHPTLSPKQPPAPPPLLPLLPIHHPHAQTPFATSTTQKPPLLRGTAPPSTKICGARPRRS